ncbi:nickel pincer cofactor biosynthesis protein LarB, partial [Desulfoprunum benzoelyticum]|uniref:nickel pincer cofactor biosynthesis protein LarB n=1 Tax=Desulfoprunum benzoelyticum TaxID=1506996 RepID=UPI0019655E0C
MDPKKPHAIPADVVSGKISCEATRKTIPDRGQGELALDPWRLERTSVGEVVYGQGKTLEQIRLSLKELGHHHPVLATRISPEHGRELKRHFPLGCLWQEAGLFCLGADLSAADPKAPNSDVLIVTAGTSDLPVAREALGAARFFSLSAHLISDVGVAGLHRLEPHLDTLRQARVVIAVAGMEGALPSVLGGLVKAPIIAVPTSTGYGANFAGLTPLLAMLNS